MNNPIINDDLYWKYQGRLESFFKFLKGRPELLEQDEHLVAAFAHIARGIYDLGFKDATLLYEPEQLQPEQGGEEIEN